MHATPSAPPMPGHAHQHSDSGFREVRSRFRARLRDRRFWAVQGLVLVATGIHLTFDALEAYRGVSSPDLFVVLMYAIFFVPVIYASLNFGREGAIPTAIWTAILALPSIIFFHHGLNRIAEILQHFTIIALAVVIASRVDREVEARRQAEIEGRARRVSEARYRGLFESAGEAILVVNQAGGVLEANAAASQLFDRQADATRGVQLAELVGLANAAQLIEIARSGEVFSHDVSLETATGREIWVEPVCGIVASSTESAVIQVLLRDVTERRARQLGLETYARRIIQAQEEERRRIARELHDSSLQSVVLLCRQLDVFEQNAGEALPAALQQVLSDTRTSAESIADELRRFSRDLRPSILDDLGLVPAIRWLVNDLEDRTGVRGELVTSGSIGRLAPDIELGVFRMAQEAMHNVERHAHASTVSLRLTREEIRLVLVVEDDGRGMPLDQTLPSPVRSGKLGLLGMQERARLLDGTVKIVSAPGTGTRVEVAVPLETVDVSADHIDAASDNRKT